MLDVTETRERSRREVQEAATQLEGRRSREVDPPSQLTIKLPTLPVSLARPLSESRWLGFSRKIDNCIENQKSAP
jgi:hypothetical protein